MKINCNKCANLLVDSFSYAYSCKALNCGCHQEESDFIFKLDKAVPRRVPDVGEAKCPGMVKQELDGYKQ